MKNMANMPVVDAVAITANAPSAACFKLLNLNKLT